MAKLQTVAGHESKAGQYADALRANADILLTSYPGGIYGMDWHTADPNYQGTDDPVVNAVLQFSALAALNAAARVTP